MKYFLFIIYFLSFIISGFLPLINYAQSNHSPSVKDKTIKDFLRRWEIPGASVALIKNGQIVYNKSFGEAEEGVAVRPDHLFRIASLSKPITATAILKLVQEGYINLDDKVFGSEGVLSQYENIKDKRAFKISVRNLLQHTAGWDRGRSACGDPMFDVVNIASCMSVKAPADVNSIIKYVLQHDLDSEPGTEYSYSNIGYAVLGRIIEKVSGLSYESYIQEHILKPCGIKDMKIGRSLLCDKSKDEVRYFGKDTDQKTASVFHSGEVGQCAYGGFYLEGMDAHGGWIASAEDIAKFILTLENNKHLLISQEMMNEMKKSSPVAQRYGLGCFVNSSGNWWHTGSLPGSSGMMAYTKNGTGWVILFNGNPDSGEYFREMDQLMWKII